jgi:hypothetical protein
MRTNATTARTHHNGRLAAVRRAVLRSGIPPVSSYPRRQVSSTNKRWIPAFAGMTTNSYTCEVIGDRPQLKIKNHASVVLNSELQTTKQGNRQVDV